jgi:GNAT superfamily N-acetyltransferase
VIEVQDFVTLSRLDEEHFGIRTARASDVDIHKLKTILAFCKSNRVELLIAKCSPSEIRAVHAMEDLGFRLMDTIIFFSFSLSKQQIPSANVDHVTVRQVGPGDESRVKQIAHQAFHNYTGHYHMDERLDKVKSTEVYALWAYNCCISGEYSDTVFVAEYEGTIAGFSAMKKHSDREWIAILGAVEPKYQGFGIGKALNIARIKYCRAQHAEHLTSPISISNLSGQVISQQFHYHPSRYEYTFHKWFTS